MDELPLKFKSIELSIQFSINNLDEDAMLKLTKKIYNMLVPEELKGKENGN